MSIEKKKFVSDGKLKKKEEKFLIDESRITWRKYNFNSLKHFDGDGVRQYNYRTFDGVYGAHHNSGAYVYLYYLNDPSFSPILGIEISGRNEWIGNAKSDLENLIGVKLKESD